MSREYPGATTRCLFCMPGVRRTVRPEEEARVTAGNGIEEGAAVRFRLEHRQTVVVWPDAACKQGVPVHQQVLRCDGCRHTGACTPHEFNRLASRDVLEHDAQLGVPVDDR